jgi:hypothetical protein
MGKTMGKITNAIQLNNLQSLINEMLCEQLIIGSNASDRYNA